MTAAESGASTPNSRFTSQAATAEDLLKSQTVGLVQLDEFRKRRRDVEELKLKQSRGSESDGALTPKSHGSRAGTPGAGITESGGDFKKKKKRKINARGLLSFGGGDEENEDTGDDIQNGKSTPKSQTGDQSASPSPEDLSQIEQANPVVTKTESIKRKFIPNPNTKLPAPKVMTKAAMAAEAEERERLRKEFLEVQGLVRSTDVAVPFVFYDGSNLPGGTVKIKKGEHIWLFLERCRKVRAEMGAGKEKGTSGNGATRTRTEGRKSWARISVDDLLCVRGGIIIPHHYDFYYFIANKIEDPAIPGQLLFNYTGTVAPKPVNEADSLLRRPKDETIEGQDDDPTYTKVVDRRWYERNKHIYPASLWREYKAGREFEELAKGRKDAQGNSFFFS